MANLVEQINDAVEARMLAKTSYTLLTYKLDLEKNSSRGTDNGYGARPISSSPGINLLGHYTQTHDWELILTNGFADRCGDENKESQGFALYDKMDDLFVDLISSKAGLTSIILNIEQPSMNELEYLDKMVVLRAIVSIQYRNALT